MYIVKTQCSKMKTNLNNRRCLLLGQFNVCTPSWTTKSAGNKKKSWQEQMKRRKKNVERDKIWWLVEEEEEDKYKRAPLPISIIFSFPFSVFFVPCILLALVFLCAGRSHSIVCFVHTGNGPTQPWGCKSLETDDFYCMLRRKKNTKHEFFSSLLV